MLEESIRIQGDVRRVYGAFADLAGWKAILPDVLDVQVLYDDGRHQEFLMTVSRPAGPETVRGIRFCEPPHRIALFQPQPPPGFQRMVGVWTFDEEPGATRVKAERWFEPSDPATSREALASRLRGHLKANLELFRKTLEGHS
ncbi:SRPBCC family protein [Myxococcus sp. RHSTA-1-4]|uniref:SRPBCC family protein n=1 Tax=Myxococcus sp. RHSTA-1-4 TaxID=2874601 RepID=UPI001CBEB2FF|nr:SRPBCC family protein [Myxococcus sp. RHSTA-1-4]MBZ4417202.1 SRPBCC family protein [Myxococcus sp. RHSTA-1-4]